jgi:hypothetical protein
MKKGRRLVEMRATLSPEQWIATALAALSFGTNDRPHRRALFIALILFAVWRWSAACREWKLPCWS